MRAPNERVPMPTELRSERRDETTLVLTLSDPATRNLLSLSVLAAGIEALNVAEADTAVRSLVLHGDGGHFCAGGDAAAPNPRGTGELAPRIEWAERFDAFVDALRTFPKPVIAAVEGVAAGSGCALALACDLVVAAGDARFSFPVQAGPEAGTSWLLARGVPRQLALEWLWLGEAIEARRLLAHGLVNQVCPQGTALAEACAIAAALARLAPGVVAGTKELLADAPRRSFAEQLAAERRQLARNLLRVR